MSGDDVGTNELDGVKKKSFRYVKLVPTCSGDEVDCPTGVMGQDTNLQDPLEWSEAFTVKAPALISVRFAGAHSPNGPWTGLSSPGFSVQAVPPVNVLGNTGADSWKTTTPGDSSVEQRLGIIKMLKEYAAQIAALVAAVGLLGNELRKTSWGRALLRRLVGAPDSKSAGAATTDGAPGGSGG